MDVVPLSRHPQLQALLERASSALAAAKTSAEVLEAKNLATVAHDAATAVHRLAEAKKAQDDVLETIRRTQRDALLIECSAMALFADKYDEALESGEVRGRGRPAKNVPGENIIPTATDLGVSRKDIWQARRVRDFDKDEPGRVERALDAMLVAGEEPTRARLRRLLKPVGAAGGAMRKTRKAPRSAQAVPGDETLERLLALLEQVATFDALDTGVDPEDSEALELLDAISRAQANLDRLAAAVPKPASSGSDAGSTIAREVSA